MLKKTYIIADIHGYLKNLVRLLQLLTNCGKESNHKFIFIGDYIDKGPDSCGVIDILIEFSKYNECVFLRGNHEYMLTAENNVEFIEKYGGLKSIESYFGLSYEKATFETMKSYFYEIRKKGHDKFFTNLKDFVEIGEYYVFHSGYNTKYKKLEDILLNDRKSLYFSRHEFIENYRLLEGKKIIFGHTAFENGYRDGYKTGVNFGVDCGGPLAAYCIETDSFILDDGRYLHKGTKINNKILGVEK